MGQLSAKQVIQKVKGNFSFSEHGATCGFLHVESSILLSHFNTFDFRAQISKTACDLSTTESCNFTSHSAKYVCVTQRL